MAANLSPGRWAWGLGGLSVPRPPSEAAPRGADSGSSAQHQRGGNKQLGGFAAFLILQSSPSGRATPAAPSCPGVPAACPGPGCAGCEPPERAGRVPAALPRCVWAFDTAQLPDGCLAARPCLQSIARPPRMVPPVPRGKEKWKKNQQK